MSLKRCARCAVMRPCAGALACERGLLGCAASRYWQYARLASRGISLRALGKLACWPGAGWSVMLTVCAVRLRGEAALCATGRVMLQQPEMA